MSAAIMTWRVRIYLGAIFEMRATELYSNFKIELKVICFFKGNGNGNFADGVAMLFSVLYQYIIFFYL